MNFIACADLHITDKMPYSDSENNRKDELFNAWDQVCKRTREINAEFILIAGDVFDDINVSPAAFRIFTDMLEMSRGIPKFMISGNHEIDEVGRSVIKSIASLLHEKELYTPMEFHSDGRILQFIRGVEILMFDFHHSYGDLNIKILEELKKSRTSHRIFVGHQPIVGMEMRDSLVCAQGIPQSWFTKKGLIGKNFELALMGDFHKFQHLKGDIKGVYIGSLIQHSFRDEGTTPVFLEVECKENNIIGIRSTKINCPYFQTIRFIESKPNPIINDLNKGGYFKVSVVGTQKYVDSININKVRDEIADKCKPNKILLSSPTITCSVPKLESIAVSRIMSDEELVEKIISTDNNILPDKLLYNTGIKYLKKAKQ